MFTHLIALVGFQVVAPDECSWTIANVDGGRFVQVRTYRSAARLISTF